MSFWRSDKFKSLYKLVQAFEFIRSEKGHKLNILKLFIRIKTNMYINTIYTRSIIIIIDQEKANENFRIKLPIRATELICSKQEFKNDV